MRKSRLHRVFDATRDQVIKSLRRPSRLFFGPLSRLLVLLPRVPAPLLSGLRRLPDRWIERPIARGFCVATAYKLFQLDRPAEAWQWLEPVLHIGRPSIDERLLGAMCLYHGLGRFKEAMSLLTRANDAGIAEAEARGIATAPFRVLDSVWARHIGHTAAIDYVIKLGLLEGRSLQDTILYLRPGSSIANNFLLRQIGAHLRVVERPDDLPFDPSVLQAIHYDYLGPRMPDQTTAYFWEVAGKTYRRWQQEGKGPLLAFPSEIRARGWAALHNLGVPEGAWFVALHVREGKWDGRNAGLHGGVLNADIATYFPALAEITRRGGWVIRMGDPGMAAIPPMANVIDYCHSDLRSDWMDVFIAACCRFMIGTSSGPAYIPPLYGVPSVLTNWWPPAQRPWHSTDIFIPKMLRRPDNGNYLTLGETLDEPFSYCHSLKYLADHEGVDVVDNEPDIILAATEEMLARTENYSDHRVGSAGLNAKTAELRLQADRIYESHSAIGMGQLASGFLRRYGELIR